jgi:hypothetical protein
MVINEKSTSEILKILLKDLTKKNTVSSLSEEIKIARPGTWKALKRLESKKLIKLEPIGKGKTSTYEITLNWSNPLLEKTLSFLLTEDSLKQDKWRYNFKDIENNVDFLILFGSILHSPKEANDIDILSLVSKNKNFIKIDKIITNIQATQDKQIHAINLSKQELMRELKNKNKAYLEALKKGVILFGQEKFIKFIEDISI